MKPLKINLFSLGDANDINTWSNVPYFFARALTLKGINVRRINLIPKEGPAQRLISRLNNIVNRAAPTLGFRPHPTFRIPAFHRLINHHLRQACRQAEDSDLNVFLTFSFSSYQYSNTRVAHYCDRTYEHHLVEQGVRPSYVGQWFIRKERQNLKNADYIFTFNRPCLEFIREHYNIRHPILLTAGLNLKGDEFPEPRELISRKEGSRNILFIGRGYHHRGVDILLAAFQRFNSTTSDPFTLHLVGMETRDLPGPQTNVICHGYLRKDDPAQYRRFMDLLASARLFVFPMRHGPIPGVLREALWMCTPVILTDVPHASDRIQDGRNGLLAATPDPDLFARCMGTLVSDRARWRQMAEYARQSVQEETWDSTAARFLEEVR